MKVGETKSKGRGSGRVGLCPCVGSLKNPVFSVLIEYMLHIQETLKAETCVKQGEKGSFFPNCYIFQLVSQLLINLVCVMLECVSCSGFFIRIPYHRKSNIFYRIETGWPFSTPLFA